MWDLYLLAKNWKCRPSELVGLSNTYEAYCLDEAVSRWGTWVEGELNGVKAKSEKATQYKQQLLFNRIFDDELETSQKHRDPAVGFSK